MFGTSLWSMGDHLICSFHLLWLYTFEKGEKTLFEMERKEMYSHMFKFRASCLKPSPEKLQGSVPTPPHCMFYLVIVWCKIHFKNCYQRNQTTVSSSKGESPTYWCKRVMNVRTHLLSVLLLKLTENGECLGHNSVLSLEMCVFLCWDTCINSRYSDFYLFYRADVWNKQLLPLFFAFPSYPHTVWFRERFEQFKQMFGQFQNSRAVHYDRLIEPDWS